MQSLHFTSRHTLLEKKMINKDRLTEQLMVHEGLKLQPYKCTAGKLTIGVGRNLDDVGITDIEAKFMLENDIARCLGECAREFDWFIDAPELIKEAVINLVFNMGISRFRKFKKTIEHLSNKEYTLAGAELLNSRYAEQVPRRSEQIANQIADCQSTSDS